jgi:hypothetical protein
LYSKPVAFHAVISIGPALADMAICMGFTCVVSPQPGLEGFRAWIILAAS